MIVKESLRGQTKEKNTGYLGENPYIIKDKGKNSGNYLKKELWRINDILNMKRPTGNVDILKEDENTLLVYSVLGMIF